MGDAALTLSMHARQHEPLAADACQLVNAAPLWLRRCMEHDKLVFKPDGTGWCESALGIYSLYPVPLLDLGGQGRLRVLPYRAAHRTTALWAGSSTRPWRAHSQVGYRIALEVNAPTVLPGGPRATPRRACCEYN